MHGAYRCNAKAFLSKKECIPAESENKDGCGYLQKESSAAFIAPFWSVRKATTEDDTVNMRLVTKEVMRREHPFLRTVKIPVLVNDRPLKAGEMLVWYKPAAAAPELEPLEPVTEPTGKKRLTKSDAASSSKRLKK